METLGSRSLRGQFSWWSASRGSGTLDSTLLDGQGALALEAIEIRNMCTDSGEEVVFRKLDQRFQDKVAADRMGEAMEETFGNHEKWDDGGFHWNDQHLSLPTFRRKGLTCRRRAATRKSWEFDEVCTAIRTSFPGCPPDPWSH